MEKKIDSFTPLFDCLAGKYKLSEVAVFGKIYRYSTMRLGYCIADEKTMGDELGLSDRTVKEAIKVLISSELIIPNQIHQKHRVVKSWKVNFEIFSKLADNTEEFSNNSEENSDEFEDISYGMEEFSNNCENPSNNFEEFSNDFEDFSGKIENFSNENESCGNESLPQVQSEDSIKDTIKNTIKETTKNTIKDSIKDRELSDSGSKENISILPSADEEEEKVDISHHNPKEYFLSLYKGSLHFNNEFKNDTVEDYIDFLIATYPKDIMEILKCFNQNNPVMYQIEKYDIDWFMKSVVNRWKPSNE
jgi:hypothetical protein